MKYYLAIDLYPFSCRHVVGRMDKGELKTDEVYRFLNKTIEADGRLVWDTAYLFSEVVAGITECFKKYPKIESIAIDSFGADYVLMRDDEAILPSYSYLDKAPADAVEEMHRIMPFKQLYERTGVGFRSFNSIYQLYLDKREGRLDDATDFLMMPEYLAYMLTGNKVKEITGAVTTGMINSSTQRFDRKIWSMMNLPTALDAPLYSAGKSVGRLKADIAKKVGSDAEVVLSATNAAACAIESIDCPDHAPYVLIGGKVLVGIKTACALTDDTSRDSGYSNARGPYYNRYQKSVPGTEVVEKLARELCPNADPLKTVELARMSSFNEVFDIEDPAFSDKEIFGAIDAYLFGRGMAYPKNMNDYFKAAYNSIAFAICEVIEQIEHIKNELFYEVYISGDGAESGYIGELVALYSRKNVVIKPACDSAIGNLKIQIANDKKARK